MFKIIIAVVGIIIGGVMGGLVPLVISARALINADTASVYEGPTEVFTSGGPFLVPIVVNGVQTELLTVSIAYEIQKGWGETIELLMPRIRHEVLQVLYQHYHQGGFSDNFMSQNQLDRMLSDMTAAAQSASDARIQKVLLQGLFKQEL